MKFACFKCRKVFNRPQGEAKIDPGSGEISWTPPSYSCSECESPLHHAGAEFRPPSRQSLDQWKKAELLIRRGFLFHKDAGPYPRTLSEARVFVRQYKTLQDYMAVKNRAWKRRVSDKAMQAKGNVHQPLSEFEIRKAR